MLVLARRPGESIRLTLEDGTEIFVKYLGGNAREKVRLGIEAPVSVKVLRGELVERQKDRGQKT